MKKHPSISVVMPVYNGEKYLAAAIESILDQTFGDFEFIIINDGSSDATAAIVKKYQQQDNRIVFIDSHENKKLAFRRNQSIAMARGQYIAYMDADDICELHRFEKQFAFMEANPSVAYCASRSRCFGAENMIRYDPEENAAIRLAMFYKAPLTRRLCNATSFIRKTVFNQFKNSSSPEHYFIEDLEFQLNMAMNSRLVFRCIPEVLINRRVHQKATTVLERPKQSKAGHRLRVNIVKAFLNERETALYTQLLEETLFVQTDAELMTMKSVFDKIKVHCSNNISGHEREDLDKKDYEIRLIFAALQQRLGSPVNFAPLFSKTYPEDRLSAHYKNCILSGGLAHEFVRDFANTNNIHQNM